jgi:hypothetical protein
MDSHTTGHYCLLGVLHIATSRITSYFLGLILRFTPLCYCYVSFLGVPHTALVSRLLSLDSRTTHAFLAGSTTLQHTPELSSFLGSTTHFACIVEQYTEKHY